MLEVVLVTFGAVCWSVSMFMLGREWEKDHPKPLRLGYWDGSDEVVVFTPDDAWDFTLTSGPDVTIDFPDWKPPTRPAPYDWKLEPGDHA